MDVDIVAGGDPVPEDAGQLVGDRGGQGVDGLVVGVGRLEKGSCSSFYVAFQRLILDFWERSGLQGP